MSHRLLGILIIAATAFNLGLIFAAVAQAKPIECLGDPVCMGTPRADVIEGSRYAETIKGKAGADFLYGYPGRDTIEGGLGGDVLAGGLGEDILAGGWGNDTITAWNDHKRTDYITGGPGCNTFRIDRGIDWVLDFGSCDLVIYR